MSQFASLEAIPAGRAPAATGAEEARLDAAANARELDRFLASVERRAFRLAEVALRHREDALDVVQAAMLALAQHYAARPSAEWPPLFHRILVNAIRDAQRRRRVRGRFLGLLPGAGRQAEDESAPDPFEQVPDPLPGPGERVAQAEAVGVLDEALRTLPPRQLEAFCLRCLEGLDVAATAAAMGCSEGSVKTHYFRALQALRAQLAEVWT
jgi:RNA polymerase sigma-70 factor, ECF subfamily